MNLAALDLARPLPDNRPSQAEVERWKELCHICLDPLHPRAGSHVKIHAFCMACIRTWLKDHSHCPTCREPMTLKSLFPLEDLRNPWHPLKPSLHGLQIGLTAGLTTAIFIRALHSLNLSPLVYAPIELYLAWKVAHTQTLSPTNLKCAVVSGSLLRFSIGRLHSNWSSGGFTALGITLSAFEHNPQGFLYPLAHYLLLLSCLLYLEGRALSLTHPLKATALSSFSLIALLIALSSHTLAQKIFQRLFPTAPAYHHSLSAHLLNFLCGFQATFLTYFATQKLVAREE